MWERGSWRWEGWRGHGGGERLMGRGESKSLLPHADLTPDGVWSDFRVYFQVGVTRIAKSQTQRQQSSHSLSSEQLFSQNQTHGTGGNASLQVHRLKPSVFMSCTETTRVTLTQLTEDAHCSSRTENQRTYNRIQRTHTITHHQSPSPQGDFQPVGYLSVVSGEWFLLYITATGQCIITFMLPLEYSQKKFSI